MKSGQVLRSPYYMYVNLWNQLEEDIQNIMKFKSRVLDMELLKIGNA